MEISSYKQLWEICRTQQPSSTVTFSRYPSLPQIHYVHAPSSNKIQRNQHILNILYSMYLHPNPAFCPHHFQCFLLSSRQWCKSLPHDCSIKLMVLPLVLVTPQAQPSGCTPYSSPNMFLQWLSPDIAKIGERDLVSI